MAVDDVLFESTTETSAKCYTLSLSPAVVFRNLLPLTVVCHCKVVGSAECAYKHFLDIRSRSWHISVEVLWRFAIVRLC